MEYSIKEIARCVEISEQGLYKRIKTNYEDYLKKGAAATARMDQQMILSGGGVPLKNCLECIRTFADSSRTRTTIVSFYVHNFFRNSKRNPVDIPIGECYFIQERC